MTDFRPISMSNVPYKLIAKILANRLKLLLPLIISETQSVFMFKRLIMDNILIAHETLPWSLTWARRMIGLNGLSLRRLCWRWDLVKSSFIHLISMCIQSITYSIMLNGQPYGFISPQRGLRQGDTLLPYLFLLVTEGLLALFKKAENDGKLRGVSLCSNGPWICHLFFADDSLVICRATIFKCVKIQEILQLYE